MAGSKDGFACPWNGSERRIEVLKCCGASPMKRLLRGGEQVSYGVVYGPAMPYDGKGLTKQQEQNNGYGN